MADLVTRLLLNSSQFDNNIRKSTLEVQSFQSIGKSVAGTVTKFAGALGIAYSATEVLTKGINSNATAQAKFNDLVGTASDVTGKFFSAIYSGDWSMFNEGIMKAINNAKDYVLAYREIQRTLEVTGIRYEQTDARKTQLESIIEDENRTLEERKRAQAELDRLLMMGIADIREASKQTEETLIKGLKGVGYNGNVNNAQSLILDLYDPNSAKYKRAKSYKDIRTNYNNAKSTWAANSSSPFAVRYFAEAEKEYNKFSDEEKKLLDNYVNIMDSLTSDRFNQLKDLFDKINDLNDKAGTWQKDRTGASDEIIKASTETKKPVKTVVKEAVKEAVKEVELKPIDVPVKLLTADDFDSEVNKMVRADIESGKIQIKGVDPSETQANLDYMESLNGIATVMGSVTNMTSEGAAGWLQYSANVINSVAAMLPVLANLFGLEAALGVAKQSKLVFPMNVIAMAATTAGLVAALASIPKFATGGIVGGSSYTGDYNLARVNSGEMILNKHQQGNLFGMLNSGSSSLNGGNVKFRIEGKDLVGVLGSYNNKVSKYR